MFYHNLSCLLHVQKASLVPGVGALRGRRQGAAAPPAPPARDFVPWNPDSIGNAAALRGRRQGAAAPPAPPARGAAPGNPDSMHRYAKCLARMLMDNVEQAAAAISFGIPKACINLPLLIYRR